MFSFLRFLSLGLTFSLVWFFSFSALAQTPPSEPPRFAFNGETRFRYEARENRDFSSALGDRTHFMGTRIRFNAYLRPAANHMLNLGKKRLKLFKI